ncbi:MAG: hypothetical protein IJ391_03560 [Clostridia bacterium]|nr:hypothetical protein [Clostridia bacterium]
MKIQKECITENRRIDMSLNIITKITFVTSEECEYLSFFSRKLAENMLAFCRGLGAGDGISGNTVVLLTPTVTYMRDDIISIKYDLTLSSNGVLVYHKRFCVNMHTALEILLLPRFVSGKLRARDVSSFYLVPEGDGIAAVTVSRSLERGMRIGRRSDIDAYCDGKSARIKIKIPKCVSMQSLSKLKSKKGRTKVRPG